MSENLQKNLELGNQLRDEGKLNAARKVYHKAIATNPGHPLCYLELGRLEKRDNKPERGNAAFNKAVELSGNQIFLHRNNLGDALAQQGQTNEALLNYTKALAIEEVVATFHENGMVKPTIAVCKKALALDPNNPIVYRKLARAYYKQGKIDEAISLRSASRHAVYQQGINFCRDALNQDYLNLAQLYLNWNTKGRAVICFDKAFDKAFGPKDEQPNQWPYIPVATPLPATLPDGSPWPKISIVTPSFNQGEFIEETILSVINQQYPNLEHILIDGGSTDETMTVVQSYNSHFHYLVREKDRGQSEALNKGFAQASGEILTWINSDDRLAPGALYALALAFYNSGADVVAGRCQVWQEDQEMMHHLTSCRNGVMPLAELLDLENCWLAGKFFHQPELAFTRSIWQKTGAKVNESLYYSMDYELWVRFAAASAKIQVISHPIAQFRMHEGQKTSTTEKYQPELRATRDGLRSRFQPNQEHYSSKEPPKRKNKLRIVLFNDLGFVGGAGIAHQQIGRALALAGHEVIPIAGVAEWEAEAMEFSAAAAYEIIECFEPDLVIFGNLHNIQESIELLDMITAKFPTVFIMHDQWLLTGRCAYTGDCHLYQSSCDRSCPTYLSYPPLAPEQINPAFQRKRDLLLNRDNLLVLGNSQWTTNWARQALGAQRGAEGHSATLEQKFQQIALGIDLEIFQPREQKTCRQQLGLPEDKFIIITGCTSLEDQRKGGKDILAALEMLQIPNLLVIGFGYSHGLPTTENFQFHQTGFISNRSLLAHYYSAADLFVGASAEESFGQTYIEAAACGTPAVGYANGGVGEAILDGVTGFALQEKSPEALAYKIAQLYRYPDKLKLLSTLAPIHIANSFSTHSIYQSLVVALDKANWLEKLELAPISKFAVSPQDLLPLTYVKPSKNITGKTNIMVGSGIEGFQLSGFGHLEPPYPHLNLLSPSRWTLHPESKFVMEAKEAKQGHLVIRGRNVCGGQYLQLWQEEKLVLCTVVEQKEISQSNLFALPIFLVKGLNFFTLKMEKYQPDGSGRSLGFLVEGIDFLEQLDWEKFPGGFNDTLMAEQEILMDEHLQGTGWFGAENLNGKPVRWMGKVGTVILDKIKGGSPLGLKIKGVTAVDQQLISQLKVKVNGSEINGESQTEQDGSWIFEGIIGKDLLSSGSRVILMLQANSARQLSPSDDRWGSLLVESVRIGKV